MELLDYIDPQTSLYSGSAQDQIYNRRSIRSHFLFHPYLIYKAYTKPIEAPQAPGDEAMDESLQEFGGFFPVSVGIQAAYIVRGRTIKVWNMNGIEPKS